MEIITKVGEYLWDVFWIVGEGDRDDVRRLNCNLFCLSKELLTMLIVALPEGSEFTLHNDISITGTLHMTLRDLVRRWHM